ncbi:EamA family transporter [Nocardioides currus]|uniref:EamA family transporter n=2 Tax=Nocardioides currus TaxID=2133958 RepID=A0A2R7Z0H2_9ACTN|nr:EamA family transporter [Nocardioides currus]
MWASAFVVIRHVADDISPGSLGAGRLLVAALCVLPLVLRRGWVKPTRREWILLTACGVGWFGIYNLALNEGERRVDAGTAAMIIQIGPIIVAVLAVWIFGEVLHRWLVVGMVIGFGGVAIIARGYSGGGDGDLVGILLVVLAAAMYAVGVLSQKSLLRRIPSVQVVFVSFVIGAAVCLPFAHDLVGVVSEGGSTLWWTVYLGVFPTAIAFTTWAFALAHTDAGKLSLTTFLVPAITTLIAWALLDEVPPGLTFVGGALAITGVLLTRRKPSTVGR